MSHSIRPRTLWRSIVAVLFAVFASSSQALDLSVTAIGGDTSRALLGDGTDVIVGIIDSGVDETHPAFAGLDSLGRARMVAEANFVPTEPGNTGDDVHGHGTWVASVTLGDDPANIYDGLATDARFVNARVLSSSNGFDTTAWVENGIGFAIDNGAHVLNLSLNTFATLNQGTLDMDQMLDWAAEHRGVIAAVCNGNVSQAQGGDPSTRAPGGAFSVISVGRTDIDFDQVHSGSSIGPTDDGRIKPEVVGPGTSITMANDDWETQTDWTSASGCSFATPHAAGLLAQVIDYGMTNGLSTSPLVTKAALLNSADKSVLDIDGDPWAPNASGDVSGVFTVTSPLDAHSGSGQIDGARLAEQYIAGEQAAGTVGEVGWDLGEVADAQFVDYQINGDLLVGSELTATLTWFRHMSMIDDGDGMLDAGDSFSQAESLDNLDLQVFRNGTLIAESVSTVDNLEQLHLIVDQQTNYTLRVLGTDVVGSGITEEYALAWHAVIVPEPQSVALALAAFTLAGVYVAFARRRSSHQ